MGLLGTKLRLPQGTSRTWLLRCLDAAGRAVDLTGATPQAFLKTCLLDADDDALADISARVSLAVPELGLALLTFEQSDTAEIADPFAERGWQVRFALASGRVFAHEAHQGPLVFVPLIGDPEIYEPPNDYVEEFADMSSITATLAAIVDRADLAALDGALLALLPDGYRLVLGFTGNIRVEYQLGLLGTDTADAYGWIVPFTDTPTRCARLVAGSVAKDGQPCAWNATQNKWQQSYPTGAAGAETTAIAPGFDLP